MQSDSVCMQTLSILCGESFIIKSLTYCMHACMSHVMHCYSTHQELLTASNQIHRDSLKHMIAKTESLMN